LKPGGIENSTESIVREFIQELETGFDYLSGFLSAVERGPGRRALTCTDRERSWTYRELNGETNRLARALRAAGLGRGDVVMCSLFNTPEFVFCFLGAIRAGAVFSPINFRLSPREVALHLEDSQPRIYLYDAALEPVAREALSLSAHRPELLVVAGGEAEHGAVGYDRFVRGHSAADVAPEPLGPSGEIVRLYTSGTTGLPKGVPLTNVNNVLRAHDVIMHLPLTPLDRTMNLTPWFHAGGLHSGGPCPALYAGAEVVALREFRPREVLRRIERHGVTFVIGSPSVLELLARAQEKHRADLRSVKGVVAMGSPLLREPCLRFSRLLTPNLYNGYGTTETFWNTILRPFDLPDHAGAAGRACTGDLVRVVHLDEEIEHADPDDVVPRDGAEEGEVIIRTMKAPFTYHNNAEETRKHYSRGWYYTGDVGTWDEEGFLTVKGRRDHMLLVGGENVHPAQVESAINEHPKVHDSLVVGVADPVKGQVPAAYVVAADPSLSVDELRGFLSAHRGLADFKRPRFFRLVPELPLTASGKKKHYVASRWARDDFPAPSGAVR
jgi:acyl-CoA synthetase (AMP-forming)/AMP-acid ligase II